MYLGGLQPVEVFEQLLISTGKREEQFIYVYLRGSLGIKYLPKC